LGALFRWVINAESSLAVAVLDAELGLPPSRSTMRAIAAACPSARLLIAGRDQKDMRVGGSFVAYLRTLIPDCLQDRVDFAGAVSHQELIGLLSRAAVCVYPSHMEAMPMAWLEGLSMGKAVVGSMTGPGPEVIEDGVSGLLCDPHDPESIADRVIRCLKDPDLRARLGQAARRRAVEQFSVERMVDRNIEFYERVIAGRS
jgi:glycosyltransferase involved in cell wall biosynthesis